MMTKEKIVDAINQNTDFEFFGLRCDFHGYEIGDVCENSHQWWQDADNLDNFDELTEDEISAKYNEEMQCYDGGELDGVCAVKVTEETVDNALSRIEKIYNFGGEIILVAGNYAEEGNDVGEIIIENAIVIAK